MTPVEDQYAANVVLLLPFDEDLTDYSASQKTVTAYGNAAVSATQKKYGAKSLALDGTGDYLRCTLPAIGTDDFTIELWAYLIDGGRGSEWARLFHLGTGNVTGAIDLTTNASDNPTRVSFELWTPSLVEATSISTIANNSWTHLAVVRSGTSISFYVNGVLNDTTVSGLNITATDFYIGTSPGMETLKGYLDELRITKGIARYTANFTPPFSFFIENYPRTNIVNSLSPTLSYQSQHHLNR